jgi:hypothetical protein
MVKQLSRARKQAGNGLFDCSALGISDEGCQQRSESGPKTRVGPAYGQNTKPSRKQVADVLFDCSALEISDECRWHRQAISKKSTPLRNR